MKWLSMKRYGYQEISECVDLSTELWAMYATRIGIIQNLIIQHSESENSRPLAQEEYETSRNKISIRTEIW
jgi:hypothetical protein